MLRKWIGRKPGVCNFAVECWLMYSGIWSNVHSFCFFNMVEIVIKMVSFHLLGCDRAENHSGASRYVKWAYRMIPNVLERTGRNHVFFYEFFHVWDLTMSSDCITCQVSVKSVAHVLLVCCQFVDGSRFFLYYRSHIQIVILSIYMMCKLLKNLMESLAAMQQQWSSFQEALMKSGGTCDQYHRVSPPFDNI